MTGWNTPARGGHDTGGIIWHPSILNTAAEHGLYLTKTSKLVDTEAGAAKPEESELVIPLDTATVHSLRRFDEAAMRRRTVTREGRAYSSRALLDSVLPGHAASLAPVIGHGMTQDLEGAAPITNPHGFSVEWLRIEPGQQVGAFKLAEKQVLMVFAGAIDVALEGAAPVRAHSQDVFSVPADCWRTVAAAGDEAAEIAIITAGDHKKRWWRPRGRRVTRWTIPATSRGWTCCRMTCRCAPPEPG